MLDLLFGGLFERENLVFFLVIEVIGIFGVGGVYVRMDVVYEFMCLFGFCLKGKI